MGALLTRFFSRDEQEAIKAAVAQAERGTSGEIVAYVVEQSDTYEEAEWRGGAFLGSLVVLATILFHDIAADWPSPLVAGTLLGGVAGFAVGMLLVATFREAAEFEVAEVTVTRQARAQR